MQFTLPPGLLVHILNAASRTCSAISPVFVDSKRVKRVRNIEYAPSKFLDLYIPRNKPAGKMPVSLFIHGGGFRFFSKDSHAAAASRLAEEGFLVFCIDYRLTPEHPFPSGLMDSMEAYDWMVKNAEAHGGDLGRITLIGESAGANYCLALCLHLFQVRTLESHLSVPALPIPKPKAAILHCGHLHVTGVERYENDPRCFPIARQRVKQIQADYLPESILQPEQTDWGLANPLVEIEKLAHKGIPLPKGFPEIWVPVGDRDPVIGDSERLAMALQDLGQTDRLKIYPNEGHAFYALPFRKGAKAFWLDAIQFYRKHVL